MHSLTTSAMALVIVAVSSADVNAAELPERLGPYVGVNSGVSEFQTNNLSTARMPIGTSIASTGKLGVSQGKVHGTDLLPTANSLMGTKRSLLVSVGAEYRLTPGLAFTVDADRFGKLSDHVSANLVATGVRYDA